MRAGISIVFAVPLIIAAFTVTPSEGASKKVKAAISPVAAKKKAPVIPATISVRGAQRR